MFNDTHHKGISGANTSINKNVLTALLKEGNALNTFYLRLYGIRHMVK